MADARLRNGDGKQVKPENLEPMEGAGGRVFAFWGDARWSRAQLLGEIAPRALGFVPRQRRGHRVRARGAVREFTRQRTAGVRAGDGDDGGFSSERAAGDGGAWEHREGDDAGGRGSGGGGRRGQSVN